MIRIEPAIKPRSLLPSIRKVFDSSAEKILRLEHDWDPARGAPVFTVKGKYTSRGWTEWTQGFQYGSAILQYDAVNDGRFLEIGRNGTVKVMASHVSNTGVHDHGFNNVSTYGNLLRLIEEGRIPAEAWERRFYEIALKASGAVQAARWTELGGGKGFIYSFNGPHSLFADTIRSLRSLALAHQLGHALKGEQDVRISLLERLIRHAETTSKYSVYFGEGRDRYDIRGRVAHESIFNTNDGSYRCPGTQQGYSPFSTWTRGLAWVLCGYPEQLEFLSTRPESEYLSIGVKQSVLDGMLRTARAVADFYCTWTPTDGIPYWDTGAPGLSRMEGWADRPADPFNDHEPVDSSAAAIAAQGFLRLGDYLSRCGEPEEGGHYGSVGLTIARTLFAEPYLSTAADHQGLLLHSVYHRPNGWDYVPQGRKIPCGEASMWGDYHARELALMILRMAEGKPALQFFLAPSGG
jgi:unsaturated chondroitin disaccharide hydrolase